MPKHCVFLLARYPCTSVFLWARYPCPGCARSALSEDAGPAIEERKAVQVRGHRPATRTGASSSPSILEAPPSPATTVCAASDFGFRDSGRASSFSSGCIGCRTCNRRTQSCPSEWPPSSSRNRCFHLPNLRGFRVNTTAVSARNPELEASRKIIGTRHTLQVIERLKGMMEKALSVLKPGVSNTLRGTHVKHPGRNVNHPGTNAY